MGENTSGVKKGQWLKRLPRKEGWFVGGSGHDGIEYIIRIYCMTDRDSAFMIDQLVAEGMEEEEAVDKHALFCFHAVGISFGINNEGKPYYDGYNYGLQSPPTQELIDLYLKQTGESYWWSIPITDGDYPPFPKT